MEFLTSIKNVSLYGSRSQEGHISAIWDLIRTLLDAGINVNIEKKLADVLSREGYRLAVHGVKVCTRLPEATDVAISVGGDGTFLRTARWLCGREIPVLGINTGHLGYLAENPSEDANHVVSLLLSGEAIIERRLVLRVESASLPMSEWPFALNEVAFMKGAASMIDVDVSLDGYHLATYRADGLLAATPTGSTAYNLSVGGPILMPGLDCFVLAPVAPHTLTLRPVVIGAHSELEVTVTSRAKDFRLAIDGHSSPIPCGEKIRINKAPHCVLTLRQPGDNFAATLRNKLNWGK